MSGDDVDFNKALNPAVLKFLPARQGAGGNSRLSVRNYSGKYTIACHRYTLGGSG